MQAAASARRRWRFPAPPDGTGETPRQLVLDDLPYVSPTTFQGVYELSGLTEGQEYAVTVTSLDAPVTVIVYPTRGVPSFSKSGTLKARGHGTPMGTTMFVTVQGRPTEATFEIDVTPCTYVSEGTNAAPMAIDAGTQLPYEGAVGSARMFLRPPGLSRAESVYAIEGLEPGGYSVKLSAPDGTLLGVSATTRRSTRPPFTVARTRASAGSRSRRAHQRNDASERTSAPMSIPASRRAAS